MEILKSICLKEEAEIRKMHKRQRELHIIPTPLCYLDIEVQDKSGIAVAKYSDRSKSWVRNFYSWMTVQQMVCRSNKLGTSYGAGTLAVRDTAGTVLQGISVHWADNAISGNGYQGASASIINGIIIGTGTAAESFDSYTMDSIIADGTGVGQMQYQAMSEPAPIWDSEGKIVTLELERIIINNSGWTIGVNEIGLIMRGRYNSNMANCLVARDVLASTVNVSDGSQIKTKYTIQIAYPE